MFSRSAGRMYNKLASRSAPRSMFAANSVVAPTFLQTRSFADISGLKSQVVAILGGQWGDEGKGKLVDILAKDFDMVARFNGGANAGHTLVVDGKKFAFHLLPCGMLYPGKTNIIGNGVVLHVPTLLKELKSLHDAGRNTDGCLKISDRAHLLFDAHMIVDGGLEEKLGGAKIGTTKRGIGPCYASKATRHGIRVGDLMKWDSFVTKHAKLIADLQGMYDFEYDVEEELNRFKEYREILAPMVIDSVHFINSRLKKGERLLAEGANAALLDIDHGTYPYVTSSPTTAGGICTGLGIAPSKVETSIGIVKAYTTRVGSGPFPTELECDAGKHMADVGHEFGTTTGRPRRCGWLDLPIVQYSQALNGYTSINITKLDVLTGLDEIKLGVAYKLNGEILGPGHMPGHLDDLAACTVEYETMPGWTENISDAKQMSDLPEAARNYLKRIEELCEVPVSWIGVGPDREEMVTQGFKV